MSKVSKPLNICVTEPELFKCPDLTKMREQGHVVDLIIDQNNPYDLLVGPNCHFMEPNLMKHLPLVIKEARKKKYPTKEKKV